MLDLENFIIKFIGKEKTPAIVRKTLIKRTEM